MKKDVTISDTRKTQNGSRQGPTNSSQELTARNCRAVLEIEKEAKANQTVSEQIAEQIANFCGSMIFVWVHVTWFAGWIIANGMMAKPFDPFPFTFLTLVVSLEAIFLSTFILINQNHENKIATRRNHLDLQVNLLAEQENTKMLSLLSGIAEAVGFEPDDDDEAAAMREATEPKHIVDEIKKGETF